MEKVFLRLREIRHPRYKSGNTSSDPHSACACVRALILGARAFILGARALILGARARVTIEAPLFCSFNARCQDLVTISSGMRMRSSFQAFDTDYLRTVIAELSPNYRRIIAVVEDRLFKIAAEASGLLGKESEIDVERSCKRCFISRVLVGLGQQ